jgi:hypothetical protein
VVEILLELPAGAGPYPAGTGIETFREMMVEPRQLSRQAIGWQPGAPYSIEEDQKLGCLLFAEGVQDAGTVVSSRLCQDVRAGVQAARILND